MIVFVLWSSFLNSEEIKFPFLDKGIFVEEKIIKLYDSEKVIADILSNKGLQAQDWHFPEFKSYDYYDEQNKIYLGFGLNERGEIVGISLSKELKKPTFGKIKPYNIRLKENVKTLKNITIGDYVKKVEETYGKPTYIDKTGDVTIYRYYCSKEEAPNENIRVTFGIELEFKNDKIISIFISDGS